MVAYAAARVITVSFAVGRSGGPELGPGLLDAMLAGPRGAAGVRRGRLPRCGARSRSEVGGGSDKPPQLPTPRHSAGRTGSCCQCGEPLPGCASRRTRRKAPASEIVTAAVCAAQRLVLGTGLDAQLPRPPRRRRGGRAGPGARAVASAVSGSLPVPRWQLGICDATVMARASAEAFPLPPSIGIEFSKPFDSSDLGGGGLMGRKNPLVNFLHTWSEIPRQTIKANNLQYIVVFSLFNQSGDNAEQSQTIINRASMHRFRGESWSRKTTRTQINSSYNLQLLRRWSNSIIYSYFDASFTWRRSGSEGRGYLTKEVQRTRWQLEHDSEATIAKSKIGLWAKSQSNLKACTYQ